MAPGAYTVVPQSRFREAIRELSRSAASAGLLLLMVHCLRVARAVLARRGTRG
jgi:hypothetical protein